MNTSNRQSFLSVIILALSAFVFNTTEFIPIALLTDIGADFDMTASQTGIMMTVYAWIVAVLSLPMMLMTANVERKKLLLMLFGLFVISHGVSYLANSFTMLLISRIMVALTHAVFWSITASLVVRLAPDGKRTQALGILSTGGALAMVLGLPLGRLLGQAFDWRTSFGVIGIIGLIIILLLAYLLPRLPAQNSGSLSSLPDILKNKPLLRVYLMIILVITAHFGAYSYIEPFILTATDFGADFATMALLIFGVAGVVASVLFGRYYEKFGNRFVMMAFIGMLIGLIALAPMSDFQTVWTVLVFIWAVSLTALALSLQIRVLSHAPKATDIAMSIFSGTFNIGIGGGAVIGSLVIAGFGIDAIGYVSALILMIAMIIFTTYTKSRC